MTAFLAILACAMTKKDNERRQQYGGDPYD